jgi:hypothetical protein
VAVWLLACAAVLLSLERICDVGISRAPESVRAWSTRWLPSGIGDPVQVVGYLFIGFKIVQAGVFLAWCYVHGDGSLLPTGDVWNVAAGGTLVLAGQFLSTSVFYRLGPVGVFYGNQLGHELPWCDAFPFTYIRHPQYVGTLMSIWGFFAIMRFPHADWVVLPLLETVYYSVGAHYER